MSERVSGETASHHPHQPPGLLSASGGEQGLPPHALLPSGWEAQEASPYVSGTVRCLWVEGALRGKAGHVLPHPWARQPWPTLFCTGQGPPGPEPLRQGKDVCPFRGLCPLTLPQTVPSITGRESLGQTPHDHPFLDPDSSPPDHRGPVAGTQQTRERRSSISFLCWEPGRWRPFLSVVRTDRSL